MQSDGDGILLSPLFPAQSNSKQLLFSYRPGHTGKLQLRFRRDACSYNCWTKLWDVHAGQAGQEQALSWHEAKVVIPASAIGLQFMAVGYADDSTTHAAVDHLVVAEVVVSRPFAELSLGWQHSCILHKSSGEARCWGLGGPQLGQESGEDIGDEPHEMRALPAIDLGKNRTAVQISAGYVHTAVLLDDGTVKLVGLNLPAVDLGGHTALQVAAGDGWITCALLDDYSIKCGTYNLIDRPMAMGAGRTARQISFRPTTTTATKFSSMCALLDDNTIKCWQICDEQRAVTCWQDMPEGDDLPPVDLGEGHVKEVHGGTHYLESCALMHDGSAVCWPRASSVGSQVDLGGRRVRQFSSGCVLLDDFTVKCWGPGDAARLGQGDTASIGLQQLADLPPIDLGLGRTARHIASSDEHACAVLDDDSVKCWGRGLSGRLGRGDVETIGDAANEMGDDLLPVELSVPDTKSSVHVRLHGDSACAECPVMRGQVQILYQGTWGAVCDDAWDDVDSRVLCRQVGLAGGTSISRFGSVDGNASTLIWMDDLACIGNETNLGHCPFRGWGVHDCNNFEVAGVACQVDAWSDFSTFSSPAQRTRHSAAWLSSRKSMLVHGGEASAHFNFFADTWLYSLVTQSWVQLTPTSGPAPRAGHSAVWDDLQ